MSVLVHVAAAVVVDIIIFENQITLFMEMKTFTKAKYIEEKHTHGNSKAENVVWFS